MEKNFLGIIWKDVKESIASVITTWIIRVLMMILPAVATWYHTYSSDKVDQDTMRGNLEYVVQQVIKQNDTALEKSNGCK